MTEVRRRQRGEFYRVVVFVLTAVGVILLSVVYLSRVVLDRDLFTTLDATTVVVSLLATLAGLLRYSTHPAQGRALVNIALAIAFVRVLMIDTSGGTASVVLLLMLSGGATTFTGPRNASLTARHADLSQSGGAPDAG